MALYKYPLGFHAAMSGCTLPWLSVARAITVYSPARGGFQAWLHVRQAYRACSFPNSAGRQLAPASVDTSTFRISASPAQATPCICTTRPRTVAPSFGVATTDFTFSAVTGCVSSGLTEPPGATGWLGNRYPGFMKLPSTSFSSTLISVSHLHDAAPIQPGTRARAGNP